jgi:hypothetical protein
MRRKLSAFALLWLGAGGLAMAAAAPQGVNDEYQVYRAFLDSSYAEKVDFQLYEKLGIYFIYNIRNDNPGDLVAFFKARADLQLDPGLAQAFVTANHSPRKVDRTQLPVNLSYSSQFIQKNVYSLSRVGFNARKDEALFYASFSSLMEDGHGSLLYLKKTNGTWSVAKAAAVWMYGASVHPFNP